MTDAERKQDVAKTLPSLEGFVDIVKYIGITCDFFFKAKIS